MRKIIFLDMDDVIVDFHGYFKAKGLQYREPVPEMHAVGFFQYLPPMRGSHTFVREVQAICKQAGYELHVLTQPVKYSAHSYSEKVTWIGMHFPELVNNIIMTQDKSLLSAPNRILIDDNVSKWKASFEINGGKFIQFDHELARKNPNLAWAEVRSGLIAIIGNNISQQRELH